MRALHGMLLEIENLAHGTHGTDMVTVRRVEVDAVTARGREHLRYEDVK
jgi:hypothetical protein